MRSLARLTGLAALLYLSLLAFVGSAAAQAPAFDATAHAAQVAAAVEEAPSVTDAPAEPPSIPAEVSTGVELIGKSLGKGRAGWLGGAIGVLILLVSGLRAFGSKLHPALGGGLAGVIYPPALAVLLAVGGAWTAGQTITLNLILGALIMAATGMGLFSGGKAVADARAAGKTAAANVTDRASALASIRKGTGG